MITTAWPSESRHGHTCTSPSPDGSCSACLEAAIPTPWRRSARSSRYSTGRRQGSPCAAPRTDTVTWTGCGADSNPLPRSKIEQLVWQNPIAFFAQSGRLDEKMLLQPARANLRETFDGNSVLRGQDPDKM